MFYLGMAMHPGMTTSPSTSIDAMLTSGNPILPVGTPYSPKQSMTEQNPDYQTTNRALESQDHRRLPIDPLGINVVAGHLGRHEPAFANAFINHMNLWLDPQGSGPHRIEWTLVAPEDGEYEVAAVVLGKGSRLMLTCNGVNQETVTAEANHWEQLPLGSIALHPGDNTLLLTVDVAEGFRFDVLELIQPAAKAEQLEQALAMRCHPAWFKDAVYGLMFQWTNRATPPEGRIKPWEQKVNDFKIDAFVEMVQATGAAYVLWSVTWGNQYISAPIMSLDALIEGRTTKRDLLGEMADALHERGIKLIFYYHYGYDCGHSIDADWMKASGGYKPDKTDFYQNWMAITAEIGDRYGDKLHGWWFDGGQRYYNCHFDSTPGDQGILSAPFKQLTQAAKRGNPQRIVAYNSWIKPRQTEFQDYFAGEGAGGLTRLEDGIFPDGPQQGLMAHGCFIFEKTWGHIERDAIISQPRHDFAQLANLVQKAQDGRFPLSINLEMYEDGSVSPDSVALLKKLRKIVRPESCT
ncbi:MAG TPA: hypothetical protein DCR55_07105 [Lentisphaeria bacterium]|nr:hypothetical protein [Lentisphaeria bacterium]